MREFHLSAKARRHFQFDDVIFSFDGRVIFANFRAVRLFTQKLLEKPGSFLPADTHIRPGEINAIGLMDEIFHYVVNLYQQRMQPHAIEKLIETLSEQFGLSEINHLLLNFLELFPPQEIHKGKITPQAYLAEHQSDGTPNREIAFQEILLLWLENKNPAYRPYNPLFNDSELQTTIYTKIFPAVEEFFQTLPGFGPKNQNLIDLLRSPSIAEPDSITGQLEYIKKHWGEILGDYLHKLLSGLDLLKEEEKPDFFGPGPVEIPVYDSLRDFSFLEERYSQDRDWMPNLVLIAKNTHVWLYQLSKQYQRPIRHLSDIPEEEIAALAEKGITGLWLIGLWERSQASARIKQLCGNPEAISSAYALHEYEIAASLGGDQSYQHLSSLAGRYGIRLASDMVPNHMAIDSRWVYEHPDWFISLPYSPFPAYNFTGPDLSHQPNISLHIDDHYYDRTDAAVVFKRTDNQTGSTQFIYHGNDGTSFPWNDTAQLDYLKPEVREAVIQTILQVARKFPIIRFDAAMTLTRKHYQRLWFPQPGTGGDIPSRADYGMTSQQFNQAMPNEFWREVVDRMAVEAPDTLLLAEAFWLMESYFVRTLGMHRVYNSAFMNLLRDEENAKYRALMKNTLEFDPEILKRFVNFMNNPDERTAVDQFGKGDKYFGICTLMVTLPGLPMFGHGQIEGYTEKYGMEYQKSYWDEQIDPDLLDRHRREIFPLLYKRYIFANVENFLLYDFFIPSGSVDENVFAFSNRAGSETGFVICNNRYEQSAGWIRTSVGALDKFTSQLTSKTLGDGLLLQNDPEVFTVCRDQISGLEFLFSNTDIYQNGLYFELNGYQHHVFTHFRQLRDQNSILSTLYRQLHGSGVSSLQNAIFELEYASILHPLKQILNQGWFQFLYSVQSAFPDDERFEQCLSETDVKINLLLQGITEKYGFLPQFENVNVQIARILQIGMNLTTHGKTLPPPVYQLLSTTLTDITIFLNSDLRRNLACLFSWIFLHPFAMTNDDKENAIDQMRFYNEWHLDDLIRPLLNQILNGDKSNIDRSIQAIKLMLTIPDLTPNRNIQTLQKTLLDELTRSETQQFIGVNYYNDIAWVNRENFEEYLNWVLIVFTIQWMADCNYSAAWAMENILRMRQVIQKILTAAHLTGYRLDQFLDLLESKNGSES